MDIEGAYRFSLIILTYYKTFQHGTSFSINSKHFSTQDKTGYRPAGRPFFILLTNGRTRPLIEIRGRIYKATGYTVACHFTCTL